MFLAGEGIEVSGSRVFCCVGCLCCWGFLFVLNLVFCGFCVFFCFLVGVFFGCCGFCWFGGVFVWFWVGGGVGFWDFVCLSGTTKLWNTIPKP